MSKPNWDDLYMTACFVLATRSIDTSTKCGCIVVDEDYVQIAAGYNSPPRGCNDTAVPMTRPEKYPYMIHAEENAIINAARTGACLKGSTFYITGFPCSRCFRGIRNVGAKRIIYGPNMAAMHTLDSSIDKKDFDIIEFMNSDNRIEIVEYRGDCTSVFDQAKEHYIKKKKEQNG